jgi:hypothetical protein
LEGVAEGDNGWEGTAEENMKKKNVENIGVESTELLISD